MPGLARSAFALVRIGLEAGPLSQWLYAAMRQAGLAVELLETRHVRDAFKAMPVKSDRNDARGIAQLMRLGWFRPGALQVVGRAGGAGGADGAQLSKLRDVENSVRGILRGFGLKVDKTTPRELCRPHPRTCGWPSEPGDGGRGAAFGTCRAVAGVPGFREAGPRAGAPGCQGPGGLMSTPGVGPIVALTYASAIDDPGDFARRSRRVRISA